MPATGVDDRLGIIRADAHWLFDEHMLAGCGSRHSGRPMEMVGHADVDGHYTWIGEQCLERVGRLPTKSRGQILGEGSAHIVDARDERMATAAYRRSGGNGDLTSSDKSEPQLLSHCVPL
jgi:hypothetical protein